MNNTLTYVLAGIGIVLIVAGIAYGMSRDSGTSRDGDQAATSTVETSTTTTTTAALSTTATAPASVQDQVNAVYARLHAAVTQKDAKTFYANLETDEQSSAEQFVAANATLKTAYPDLVTNDSRIIRFAVDGDWAAYYFLSDLSNQEDTTVRVIRFHKVNGTWKVSDQGSTYVSPKSENKSAEQIIIDQDLTVKPSGE